MPESIVRPVIAPVFVSLPASAVAAHRPAPVTLEGPVDRRCRKAPGPDADSLHRHLGLDERDSALVETDVFESIFNPGKLLLLTTWKTADDAAALQPHMIAEAAEQRHRRVRTIRHYGMFERHEAAQCHPDARRTAG